MKIINASIELLEEINKDKILKLIEKAGKTCYKSESNITEESAPKFIKSIISRGHESVIEHEKISVKVVCDRAITHEIVRHRIASYSQESSRYVNYSKDKFGSEITVIDISSGFKWDLSSEVDLKKYWIWKAHMYNSEKAYMEMIKVGATPDEARSVLPQSTKTEIVMTMNLREWRHFLKLRTAKASHPQIREVANMILDEFVKVLPEIFEDIKSN